MKIGNLILAFIALVIASNLALGNNNSSTYAWGENSDEAKGRWMFLQSSIEEKQYKIAMKPLQWLLSNTPDLNVALYIHGAKVLEQNVKLEKEAVRKGALQDSVLWLYDERIKRFGNEASVLNRKGRVAYKYLRKRKGKEAELYELYSKIYELNKNEMLVQNATNYFKTSVSVYKLKTVEKGEVIAIYSSLLSFLDAKEVEYSANEKKLGIVAKNRLKMAQYFDKYVPVSCEEIESSFGANYKANPTIDKAKSINALLIKKKCLESGLFIETNNKILEVEPSSKRYSVAAKLYLSSGKMEESYNYFTKAIELESNDSVKSVLQLELAKITATKGDYSKARSEALAAIKLNLNNKKAYEFIGDLYVAGAAQCNSNDILVNKALYIAAYNQYSKAGNSSKMASAKEQFPTMEDIFVRNKKEGDLIKVGCWINENVALKKK